MIRLYGYPLSLNVERVQRAVAHKALPVEVVRIDPEDRTPVEKISGQKLVPVIDDDGMVVSDSTEILRYLEERYPEPRLFPVDRAEREALDVFLDWFNLAWKRPPNLIHVEEKSSDPDEAKVTRWAGRMRGSLDRFEALLEGRDYLWGDRLTAADCAAHPFLRFTVQKDRGDPWRFHHILMDHLETEGGHPNLVRWIDRVDEHPLVPV